MSDRPTELEQNALPPEGSPAKPPLEYEDDPIRAWTLRGIMLALLLWGLYHTLGVFLYNHDPRKAAIVFGCSAAFLIFWAVLLLVRRGRTAE